MDTPRLGRFLKVRRRNWGLKQEDLAGFLGVSVRQLKRYEGGRSLPVVVMAKYSELARRMGEEEASFALQMLNAARGESPGAV